MSEPNVRLSESAMAYVEAKAREGNIASTDEVVEALVQKAIRRAARQKRIEELLIEGLESGPGIPITPGYWEQLRRRIRDRQAAAKGSTT